MAKPWAEVEANPTYQALAENQKLKAKTQYFNQVVSVKPEFKSLTPEKQSMAQNQFFGNSPEPRSNLLTNPGKTLARSGGEFVGSIASAVIHPVRTAKAIGGLAVGAGQKLVPGKQDQERYVDALAEQYKDRYGSVEAAKKTILEDPIGFMSDASMVVGGAGAALKGVGSAGKLSKVSQVGNVATRASNFIDPLAATLKVTGKGAELALRGKKIAPFANKLDQGVIKAADDLGVELPASAKGTSRVVPLAESFTAKGFFGKSMTKRIEKAYEDMNRVSAAVVSRAGKYSNLSSAGMDVFQGTKLYRQKFIEIKNKLYDEAIIPRSGKIIEVNPTSSLDFIDDVLKNKREAAELLGSAQDIQYFDNLRKGLTPTKTVKSVVNDPYLGAIEKEELVSAPLNGKKVQSAIKELNEKLNNISDPIATGNKGTLKKLVALMSNDLDDAIVAQRPDLAQSIQKANSFYKDGVEKLNSVYGEKIFKYGESGQFDKIIPAIANKSTSIDDIPKIYEIIGAQNIPTLRSAFLDDLFNNSKNTENKFTPLGLSNEIDRYGDLKLKAMLTHDQFKSIKDLAGVSRAMGNIEKVISGSQTAFLGRVATMAASFGISPWAGVKLVLGDALFSKFIGSSAGQRLLTSGWDLTIRGQKIGNAISQPANKAGMVAKVARISQAAQEK